MWYYKELLDLFNSRINNNVLLNRYKDIVNEYFGI